MRNLRVCGSTNVNWYTREIITVCGVDYKIHDVSYYALENLWEMKVRKLKA